MYIVVRSMLTLPPLQYVLHTFKISTMYKIKWLSLFKKNVHFWSNKPISLKGQRCLRFRNLHWLFCTSGKSCENLNFPANLYQTTRGALQHTQTHALDHLAIETKLGLSVVMPMLNFSQHLPGSTKCFIHVSKSETPLQATDQRIWMRFCIYATQSRIIWRDRKKRCWKFIQIILNEINK